MTPTIRLEHRMGRAAQAALPSELVLFILKQGWACLFGGALLAAILLSRAVWQPDWPLARYDALFLYALALQAIFLATGWETRDEARVILAFHLTGTMMEWFKVSAGSWAYPEPGLFKLFDVPLFSGFMYASVGSYIARVIRIFDMRFAPLSAAGPDLRLCRRVLCELFRPSFSARYPAGAVCRHAPALWPHPHPFPHAPQRKRPLVVDAPAPRRAALRRRALAGREYRHPHRNMALRRPARP